MKDYKIVKTTNTYALELQVKELLEKGYKPLGGINSDTSIWLYDGTMYSQAMYKDE